jgi:hypothetical protein
MSPRGVFCLVSIFKKKQRQDPRAIGVSRSVCSAPVGPRRVLMKGSGVWIGLFGVLWFATGTAAQVNTERLRPSHAKIGYVTSGGIDMNLLSGNSDKFEVAPNGRLDYISDYWNWFVVGYYKYGESSKKVFANKGFVHWRVHAPLDPEGSFWEFFTQREFDDFRGITDRSLFGLGIRKEIVSFGTKGDTGHVYVGTGVMSEHEAYQVSAPSDLMRWTSYLSLRYTENTTTLLTSWYIQPVIDNFANVKALSDTALTMGLIGNAAWRISLKLSYSSQPQPDISAYDLEFQNGVTWSF